MSRKDIHLGDSVNFQNDMFDEMLLYVGRYGDDGPDGKYTVVNHKVFQEFKYDRFQQDQQEDAEVCLPPSHFVPRTDLFSIS